MEIVLRSRGCGLYWMTKTDNRDMQTHRETEQMIKTGDNETEGDETLIPERLGDVEESKFRYDYNGDMRNQEKMWNKYKLDHKQWMYQPPNILKE